MGRPRRAEGAQLGAPGSAGGGAVADHHHAHGGLIADGAGGGQAGGVHLHHSNVRGRVRANLLEMAVLGGTYPDHQVLVGVEFRGLGGDVAVRTQDDAVNHDVMAGKENGAQFLEAFAHGFNGLQNRLSVDALFKIQATVITFRHGGGQQGTGYENRYAQEGSFMTGGNKWFCCPVPETGGGALFLRGEAPSGHRNPSWEHGGCLQARNPPGCECRSTLHSG